MRLLWAYSYTFPSDILLQSLDTDDEHTEENAKEKLKVDKNYKEALEKYAKLIREKVKYK